MAKAVFTTGEVAQITYTSHHTVIRWCDQELIPHYIVPGTRHRRILREDLTRFLKRHGMPTVELEKI